MMFVENFLNKMEAKGISINVEDEEKLIFDCLGWTDVQEMSEEEINEIYNYISDKLHNCEIESDEWTEWYGWISFIDEVRLANYAKKIDSPEFDWDFYSDWHKDVYGIRPRY